MNSAFPNSLPHHHAGFPGASFGRLLFAILILHGEVTHAQPAAVHQVDQLSVTADHGVTIRFSGNAAPGQRRYFDLFPIEGSPDLVQWNYLGMATRTNASTDRAFFTHPPAPEGSRGFYRTATNILASPLPPLTGPYAVGSFSRLLTDPARTNAIRRTNHQFMVTFFYPAEPRPAVLPAPYWERAMIGEMLNWYQFAIDRTWFGRDFVQAPLAAAEERWPILLYSPSLNSERRENLYKLVELASHGFVIAAMDHRETFASAFPNGSIVRGKPVNFESPQAIYDALADRVADVHRVYDELARMNAEDPGWAGRLDFTRVGAFGFSMGGITSAELCRTDSRIHVGAGMDGIFFIPELLESPLPKPFLYLRADTPEIIMPDGRMDDRLAVMENMTRDGYYIQISGTVHWSFADLPLLTTQENFQATVGRPIHPLIGPHRVNELSAGYLVSFFKKYLRNEDDHRLDDPSVGASEVLKYVKR